MEIKSNLLKEELDILRKNSEDGTLIIDDYIEPLNEIFDIFCSQGHSGSSAPYYSNAIVNSIKCMLNHEIMSPITGEDDEWYPVDEVFDKNYMYQNKRCLSVFKHEDKAHYLNAIIWQGEEDWDTFSGTVEGISSSQDITFPFTPKTFYIDVIKDYHDIDWFIENNISYYEDEYLDDLPRFYRYIIKDKRQLNKVRKLYKFKAEV